VYDIENNYKSIKMKSISNIEAIRKKIVNTTEHAVKITKLINTIEGADTNCNVNCNGFGRIRKYQQFQLFFDNSRQRGKKLLRGLNPETTCYTSQVFQIEGCNIRCWYCYVDDCALAACSEEAEWITVDDMLDLFFQNNTPPYIIDLSGGQPDLVPEWCFWIMQDIEKRGMKDNVFVWLDDNLTTVHLMENYLTVDEIIYMSSFPKHSRTCCFKGYDENSYTFNTRSSATSLDLQLKNFKKLFDYGFDLYAYVTLTGPRGNVTKDKLSYFMDELQKIHPFLPLRTIPLIIKNFNATSLRLNTTYKEALKEQYLAFEYWDTLLGNRFTFSERQIPYEDIKMRNVPGAQ